MEGKPIVRVRFGATTKLLLASLTVAVFVHTMDTMSKINAREKMNKGLDEALKVQGDLKKDLDELLKKPKEYEEEES